MKSANITTKAEAQSALGQISEAIGLAYDFNNKWKLRNGCGDSQCSCLECEDIETELVIDPDILQEMRRLKAIVNEN